MKHYLIKRYNIGWKPNVEIAVKQKTEGKVITSDEWLEERFYLFKKYYLPSILNQTNKNFTLYIAVSEHTPKAQVDVIKTIPNVIIVNRFDAQSGIDFKKMLFETDDTIITTRVDNDDALAINFIEEIQKAYKEKYKCKPLLIDTLGYQYIKKMHMYRPQHYKASFNSPFSTVVSSKEEYKWCHEIEHTRLHTVIDSYTHIPKRLYLQVIHDTNAVNNIGKNTSDLIPVTGFSHIFNQK